MLSLLIIENEVKALQEKNLYGKKNIDELGEYMYKLCKTQNSIERQILFQEKLLELLEEKAFHKVSISELCRRTEAPRKAFYRYFDTIEDVLYAKMDSMIMESGLYLESPADVVEYFLYWKKNKRFLDVLEKQGLSAELMNRAFLMITERMKDKEDELKHMKNISSMSGLMSLLISWHHGGMKQSPKEMEALIYSIYRT